jgi:predicted DsbA family dithiol-disulfide isomerase
MYNQPKVFPSTLKAHTLLEFAGTKNDGEKQNDVAERLFKVNHNYKIFIHVPIKGSQI